MKGLLVGNMSSHHHSVQVMLFSSIIPCERCSRGSRVTPCIAYVSSISDAVIQPGASCSIPSSSA